MNNNHEQSKYKNETQCSAKEKRRHTCRAITERFIPSSIFHLDRVLNSIVLRKKINKLDEIKI